MSSENFVFDPSPRVAVPIQGSEQSIAVHRIFCVGRNYAEHVREMGLNPDREEPFYFTKSPSAYTPSGSAIAYPPGTQNFHHEMELTVAIGKGGTNISLDEAMNHVYALGCGLDMTRRDLQLVAREKGRPWCLGKDIEDGAILAPLSPYEAGTDLDSKQLHLTVNGETRQETTLGHLIWSVPEVVSHLSTFYTLQPGDLIMTGTPAGVGPVVPGDELIGTITGLPDVTLTITAPV